MVLHPWWELWVDWREGARIFGKLKFAVGLREAIQRGAYRRVIQVSGRRLRLIQGVPVMGCRENEFSKVTQSFVF